MRHFIVLMFSLSFYSCCCFINYELSTPHPLESAAFKKMKEKKKIGTSLRVQWLRLCFPTQGVRVRSLVRELVYMPQDQKTKT